MDNFDKMHLIVANLQSLICIRVIKFNKNQHHLTLTVI